MQTILAIVGLLLIAGVVGFGVYKLFFSVKRNETVDRFRYENTIDANGKVITKVVDLKKEDE